MEKMKIFCRPICNEDKYREETTKFKKLSPSKQKNFLKFKVIEKVEKMQEIWHPSYKKSNKDITPFVKIRKEINMELGTNYHSKLMLENHK